jgi:hypothetical protein
MNGPAGRTIALASANSIFLLQLSSLDFLQGNISYGHVMLTPA